MCISVPLYTTIKGRSRNLQVKRVGLSRGIDLTQHHPYIRTNVDVLLLPTKHTPSPSPLSLIILAKIKKQQAEEQAAAKELLVPPSGRRTPRVPLKAVALMRLGQQVADAPLGDATGIEGGVAGGGEGVGVGGDEQKIFNM